MKGKDAIKAQYGAFYRIMKANLDGITAEMSVEQPSPGGNCANWILGHILGVQNVVMRLANQEPVWDSDVLERAAKDPIESADEALDWDTMVSELAASEERLMAGLDALTEEQLDEDGFTDPFGRATTRGKFLNLLAVHQNYHAGQLGMSRRLLGLPGAIRAPEPQTARA